MSKEQKYPNGFMPKIAYWTSELMDEVANTKKPDLRMIESIHRNWIISFRESGIEH